MSPYMRRFIYASLFYLATATLFGILNGTTSIGYFGQFAHTHFNLLGFMSMMVFGIGYFILSRFNGTDLRFPSWVGTHFWIGNASLLGMVLFRGLAVETGSELFQGMFILSAALQAISVFMFVINIWLSLAPRQQTSTVADQASPTRVELPTGRPVPVTMPTHISSITITSSTPVADLIDWMPSAKDILIGAGLTSLALPGHLDKVRAMGVTLGMACRNHGIDFEILKADLEAGQENLASSGSTGKPTRPEVSGETMIGDVLQKFPRARTLFQQYFGDGCFDCPGQAYESVEMACRMHGVEPQKFLRELNQLVA
ncbi:MAG: DUF1858 domain-containing protein [Candidatus Zixiibacteriota bacterium]